MHSQDISVGTIAIRLENDRTCAWYNEEHPDIPYKLRSCVGIVSDDLDSDVVVTWVQVCPYHHKTIEDYQFLMNRSQLYVVGQL